MRIKLRLAAVAAAFCVSTGASAATLYGTTFPAVTPIYTVDQSTGALTAGPSTGLANIGDLASGPGGTIFGVAILGNNANTLYQFDPLTGNAVRTVAINGTSQSIVSIAYDPGANLVYGTTSEVYGGPANTLYRIDPVTGAATLIGDFRLPTLFGLDFNTADGYLYGTDGAFGQISSLHRIDTTTAAATLIGSLGVQSVFDIAFRPGDNELFLASSQNNGRLYTADITDASVTLVGPYGFTENIAGLAFAGTAVIPVPPSVALMLGGMAFLGWAARRRS